MQICSNASVASQSATNLPLSQRWKNSRPNITFLQNSARAKTSRERESQTSDSVSSSRPPSKRKQNDVDKKKTSENISLFYSGVECESKLRERKYKNRLHYVDGHCRKRTRNISFGRSCEQKCEEKLKQLEWIQVRIDIDWTLDDGKVCGSWEFRWPWLRSSWNWDKVENFLSWRISQLTPFKEFLNEGVSQLWYRSNWF